ncbi:MAG: TIGR03936 family radical SAM-associated protein, partial [candidate division Zixibacteria bacterium]|nr:TIGR03936 family radical SAM-associated protein [candidate division Zixibacteria bacterium]
NCTHIVKMRAIERALRRADVPVAYSHGFNPSMKLSFCPPLPLGFTSEAEYVDITLKVTLMPYMIDSLKMAMPPGLDILEAGVVVAKKQSLSAALNRAVYLLSLDNIKAGPDLSARLEVIMNADNLEIERQTKGKIRSVDIRPAIYDMTICENDLQMVLGIGDGGYVRPTEVAKLLFDEGSDETGFLPFHRQDLYRYDNDGKIIRAMDL